MSVPLKVRPPTVTFSGVTSTVIVVDRWSAGSCPTMLKPKVVPSRGLKVVRKKCVSVLVDGCGLAPPTVVDMAWSAESGITAGAGELTALAGDARNGMVMATPAAAARFPANGRIIRSPSNGGHVTRHARSPRRRRRVMSALLRVDIANSRAYCYHGQGRDRFIATPRPFPPGDRTCSPGGRGGVVPEFPRPPAFPNSPGRPFARWGRVPHPKRHQPCRVSVQVPPADEHLHLWTPAVIQHPIEHAPH